MPLAFLGTSPFVTLGTSCKSPSCHLIQYLFILGLSPNATNSARESCFLLLLFFFFVTSEKCGHMPTCGVNASVCGSGDSGDRD